MIENEESKTAEETVPLGAEDAAPAADVRPSSEEAECEEAIEQLATSSAEIARLEAEKADLTERLLRVAADMDNLRRRTERDVVDARKYAVTKFAGDMLAVRDNWKRALDAVPAEQRESSDEPVRALIEGVEMTAREMERLLEKNGITPIAAKGERFDPNRHQAMFELPDPSVPAGTIVEVMQDGFQIGDRVLRAALVGVSKDGPQPGSVPQDNAAAEAGK